VFKGCALALLGCGSTFSSQAASTAKGFLLHAIPIFNVVAGSYAWLFIESIMQLSGYQNMVSFLKAAAA
jgi:hypothetical protein